MRTFYNLGKSTNLNSNFFSSLRRISNLNQIVNRKSMRNSISTLLSFVAPVTFMVLFSFYSNDLNATCYGQIDGLKFKNGSTISNNASFDIGELPSSFRLEVMASGHPESMKITFSGAYSHTEIENSSPWDAPENHINTVIGTYHINVKIHKNHDGQGSVCDERSWTFTITDGSGGGDCDHLLVRYDGHCDDDDDSFYDDVRANCVEWASDLKPEDKNKASCNDDVICIQSKNNDWKFTLGFQDQSTITGIVADLFYPVHANANGGGGSNDNHCPSNFDYEVEFKLNGSTYETVSGSLPKDDWQTHTISLSTPLTVNNGDEVKVFIKGTTSDSDCDLWETKGVDVIGCCGAPPLECEGDITVRIYDQATDNPVPGIPALSNGQSINESQLPAHYYIAAEVDGNLTSVELTLDGVAQYCENVEPFTWPNGAENENDGWNGGAGSYTLNVRAYNQDDCAGEVCDEETITFTIEENCDDFTVDVGEDMTICVGETITISAEVSGESDCDCCIRTVTNTDHCDRNEWYAVYFDGSHYTGNSNMTWEECGDGTARFTGTASNGSHTLTFSLLYSGFSSSTPAGSPKENRCDWVDTDDWFYYTEVSGTIQKGSHTYQISRRGPAFQVGVGANETGDPHKFGASGWFNAERNGSTVTGDVNIILSPTCSNGQDCGQQDIPDMNYLGSYGNSHYYIKPNGDLKYHDAKSFVQSRGGHLPKIETHGENNWLANQISGSIWLGMSDSQSEGNWKWHDGEDVIYFNWADGEPNEGTHANYARMKASGEWTDRSHDEWFWVVMELECTGQGSGGINNDVTYLWSTGETTPSITVSPNTTTTYSVTVTDCDGNCSASDSKKVTVTGDFECPPDITIQCDESSEPDNTGELTTDCPDIDITYTDEQSGTCPVIINRKWQALVTRFIDDPCIPELLAHWNFSNANDKCSNQQQPLRQSNNGGLEATFINNDISSLDITKLYNNDGSSCVQGVFGGAEAAVCVTADSDNHVDENDKDDAVTFKASFLANETGKISGLSFYQRVVTWNENFGEVEYARNISVRVYKKEGGGSWHKIFDDVINTNKNNGWTLESYDFGSETNSSDFEFDGFTEFRFELEGYNPTNNGFSKKIWELDELKLEGCVGTITTNETEVIFECTQVITIDDTQDPILIGVPDDESYTCSDDVPEADEIDVKADDNCSDPQPNFEEEITGDFPCDYVITRTWTAKDDCDNEVEETQVITVKSDIMAMIDAPDINVCKDETVTLSAIASKGCGETASDYDYEWFGPGGFTSDQQTIDVSVIGTYTVVVTDSEGCSATDEVTLTNELCVSIGSTVFVDNNNNGRQDDDDDDEGIPGVTVELWRDGQLVAETETDDDGNYFFEGLEPGDYVVEIKAADNMDAGDPLELFHRSSDPTSNNDDRVDGDDNGMQPDGIGTDVKSPVITLSPGDEPTGNQENFQGGDQDNDLDANGDMTVDFGFVPEFSIGSQVFVDNNNNGQFDPGDDDDGIEGCKSRTMERWPTCG